MPEGKRPKLKPGGAGAPAFVAKAVGDVRTVSVEMRLAPGAYS